MEYELILTCYDRNTLLQIKKLVGDIYFSVETSSIKEIKNETQ